MEEKNLNAEQSLRLISEMIANTRSRIEKNTGTPLLIGGYTTVACSLAIWYLLYTTHNYLANLLWFTIPLAFTVYGFIKSSRPPFVITYIDKILNYIWWTLGALVLITGIFTFFVQLPILFFVSLLMSAGVTLTGIISKFRAGLITGITGLALSYLLLFFTGYDRILIFGGIFVIIMIIPGHILNRMAACKKGPDNNNENV